MFNNNNFGTNPMFNGGTSYPNAQPKQPPVMKNMINKQQAQMLQQNNDTIDVKLTEKEYYKSICTHKNLDTGAIALTKLPNGKHHCSICGEDFFLLNLNTPDEDILKILSNTNDLFQSIKTYYGDAPETLKDMYIIQGFLAKFLPLWHIAKSYFENATNAGGMGAQQNSDQYAFQALANMFGGGMLGSMIPGMANNGYYAPNANGYYNQPVYNPNQGFDPNMGNAGYAQPQPGQPMPQPNYQPAPNPGFTANAGYGMPTPNYGAPAAVNNNPMGYVETPQPDFTHTSGTVSMPGVNVNANTQPAPAPEMPPIPQPETPKNPNVKDAKTTVNKNFK